MPLWKLRMDSSSQALFSRDEALRLRYQRVPEQRYNSLEASVWLRNG